MSAYWTHDAYGCRVLVKAQPDVTTASNEATQPITISQYDSLTEQERAAILKDCPPTPMPAERAQCPPEVTRKVSIAALDSPRTSSVFRKILLEEGDD